MNRLEIAVQALREIGAVEIRLAEEGGDTCRRCTWPMAACAADGRCSGGHARAALAAIEKTESEEMTQLERRPTIAELEKILSQEGESSIEFLPNGEIRAYPRGGK